MIRLSDLIIATDYSRSFRYVGLVGAREHVIKRPDFLNKASWVRHVADLPRHEKTVYLHRFPSRLNKIINYLNYVRSFNNVRECSKFIQLTKPAIVIADPKLSPRIRHPHKIPENKVSRRYEKILTLLADNVAYYAYWVTEVEGNPKKLRNITK